MLIKILVVVVLLVAVVVVFVALQPSHFRIARSAVMSAPAAVVFAQVNDFHKWEAWSPWAKMDPSAKNSFDGPAAGTGAVFTWSGNNKVGQGRMMMLESRANELIRIKLEFIKPFAATHGAEFTFTPEGNQTTVNWSLSGEKKFFMKAFGLFMSMDKMVGGQYEQGLASIKSIVEKA